MLPFFSKTYLLKLIGIEEEKTQFELSSSLRNNNVEFKHTLDGNSPPRVEASRICQKERRYDRGEKVWAAHVGH